MMARHANPRYVQWSNVIQEYPDNPYPAISIKKYGDNDKIKSVSYDKEAAYVLDKEITLEYSKITKIKNTKNPNRPNSPIRPE